MKDGKIKIAACKTSWFSFDLVRGHAFGLYKGVCYVSAGEPDKRQIGNIIMYKRSRTLNNYRWSKTSIPAKSNLGKLFLDTLANSPYNGVEFQEERFDISTHWKSMPAGYKPAKRHIRQNEKQREGIINRKFAGERHFYDDTPWRPDFPTFRDHCPDTTPRPRPQRQAKTWVDRICSEAMA